MHESRRIAEKVVPSISSNTEASCISRIHVTFRLLLTTLYGPSTRLAKVTAITKICMDTFA
jgi:hypothetical protein